MSSNVYEEKPWLKHYPADVPSEIQIPVKSVNKAFDEATEKWKDRTAIIFYGRKIKYRELRGKVDRFATALSHLGVKKGDVVALLLLNSPEHIIAFYAVVKLGAVITAISPVYVSSEIKHQLEDSGTETLICQDILYENVERAEIKIKNIILTNISESLPLLKKTLGKSTLREVYQKTAGVSKDIFKQEGFYQFQDLIKKYPPNPPKVDINPDEDILTLPYTGGTTGPPKGVMITHRNVIANLTQYHAFFPILEEGKEVWLAYAPFYHAGGQVLALLDGILRGYTLAILTTPDSDDILSSIIKYKVSVFWGAPAVYEMLKDYKKTDRVNWKKLKLVLSGADSLHEETAKQWNARTGVTLHEGYGMTELTVVSHNTPLGKVKIGSVGVPICSTISAILDPEKDEFLPVGEKGEIAIRGPQVAKGYFNNPKATKECEAMVDGKIWWRTGDIGTMDKDGYFYFYDRKRDLIKYKGLRVFAREVEEVLKTHPKIKEVGVIGVPDIKVGENVKAVVVLESDARGKLSEAEIIEYCKDKLAHYKIPKIVEFVGEIPRTDVGKLSRREIREGSVI
ncbi:MAG: AMP-binding protein [Thermodesulfobacteriota bacterium]